MYDFLSGWKMNLLVNFFDHADLMHSIFYTRHSSFYKELYYLHAVTYLHPLSVIYTEKMTCFLLIGPLARFKQSSNQRYLSEEKNQNPVPCNKV